MGLFKPSSEVSDKSYARIENIFKTATSKENYTIVYAYGMKTGLLSKKISSYVIGLSPEKDTLIIVPFNVNSDDASEAIVLSKNDIVSIKSTMQGMTVIDSPKLEKKIKLMIPAYTAKNADSMYQLPIIQENAERELKNFFNEFK